MKQAFFLVPTFFFLALLQTSFLAHFAIQGFVIPVVMIAVFMLSVFAPASLAGLWGAFAGGAVLDIFSQHFFGFWTCILVLLSFAITHIMRTYVRFPLFKNS